MGPTQRAAARTTRTRHGFLDAGELAVRAAKRLPRSAHGLAALSVFASGSSPSGLSPGVFDRTGCDAGGTSSPIARTRKALPVTRVGTMTPSKPGSCPLPVYVRRCVVARRRLATAAHKANGRPGSNVVMQMRDSPLDRGEPVE
jgi:hypothetical protein